VTEVTKDWQDYERGKEYNNKINLYANNDKVERFVAGDQWHGVANNGLPTPVFNIMKRVINHFIAAVLSQKVSIQFTPDHLPEPPDPMDSNAEPEDENDVYQRMIGEVVNAECLKLWERLKMDTMLRFALKDSAISGDMCGYCFWNEKLTTAAPVEGEKPEGDIDFELLDNVTVYFGNPQDHRVQTQPYIILAFRSLVKDLREEAKKEGISQEEIDRIVGDTDNQEQSGDRAKIEMDAKVDDESAKCTCLIRFWKKDNAVLWRKSTKAVTIIKEREMDLTLYPVSWSSWDFRKNSYHGQPIGLELIPNQIYVNQMFAMVMKSLMNTAFPKVIYNTSWISKWDNRVDKAIPVSGAEDINKVATYLRGADISAVIMQTIDAAIKYTMDLLGASDAVMGNIKPDNHSAIIAVQQAAMIPLETVKGNLYQWVEDIARIWYDFMSSHYGVRQVIYKGKRVVFDFSELKDMQMNLKIDVGPSSYWSEIATAQTLDGLLKAGQVTFLQYLERMPDGFIPQKSELIDEIKKQMIAQQQQAEMQAQQGAQPGPGGQAQGVDAGAMLSQLPPETQQKFMALPAEQQAAILQQSTGGMA